MLPDPKVVRLPHYDRLPHLKGKNLLKSAAVYCPANQACLLISKRNFNRLLAAQTMKMDLPRSDWSLKIGQKECDYVRYPEP